jgi:hypothetical protein
VRVQIKVSTLLLNTTVQDSRFFQSIKIQTIK